MRKRTKDEEEKQFLLQVVEANRKDVPTEVTKKAAIDAEWQALSAQGAWQETAFVTFDYS